MTKNQDKRHLTLKGVFYPSLKRKMDKAKFGLLGLVIITAVVIAGCPMEINANIGTDTSNIKKEPGKTETIDVPYEVLNEVEVEARRLRVINLSGLPIDDVRLDGKQLLNTGEKILDRKSKMWILDSRESGYDVSSSSFKPAGSVHVTIPPDAVIVVEASQTVLLPPGDGTVPGSNQAFIIIYNMSLVYDITELRIGPNPPGTMTSEPTPDLKKRTAAKTYQFKRPVTAPGTYKINVNRSSGAPPLQDYAINVADGDIVSVFIGDEGEITDANLPYLRPVVDLQLIPNHENKQITASWLPPAIIPTDFAGYTVYLDNGDSFEINNPAPQTGVKEVWTSNYSPDGLPNGPYAVAVSSRDSSGNLSMPEVKSTAILDLIDGPLVLTALKFPQPAMYEPATLTYNGGDWSATIEWSATGTGGTLPEPLETITGISRFRGGVTYTPTITAKAENGKAFKQDTKIRIDESEQNTTVTAISGYTVAIADSIPSYTRTGIGGYEWYVGKMFETGDNSKTGATYDEAVKGLEVVLERIKNERAWGKINDTTKCDTYQYAVVHICYNGIISFNDTLILNEKYPSKLYIQGDQEGSDSRQVRINTSKGAFAVVANDTSTLVIGGGLIIEGSGDTLGAIQVRNGTLVLTSRFVKGGNGTTETIDNASNDYDSPKIRSNVGVGILVGGNDPEDNANSGKGKVYMYSGKIVQNGMKISGSVNNVTLIPNVDVQHEGEFYMYNGTIADTPTYNVSVTYGGKFYTESPLPSDKYAIQVPSFYPSISTGVAGAIFLEGAGSDPYITGSPILSEVKLNTGYIEYNGSSQGWGTIRVGYNSKLTLGHVEINNNTGYGIYVGGRKSDSARGGQTVLLDDSTNSVNSEWPKITNNTKTGIYMNAYKGTLVRMATGSIIGNQYNKGPMAGGIHVLDTGKLTNYSVMHNEWTEKWTPQPGEEYYARLDLLGGIIENNWGSTNFSGGVHYQRRGYDPLGDLVGFNGISLNNMRFSFYRKGGAVIKNNNLSDNPISSSTTIGKQVHISHYHTGFPNDGSTTYERDLKIDNNLTDNEDLKYGAFNENNGLTISPTPTEGFGSNGTWIHNVANQYAVWKN
jgi:hypothetical protein